MSAVDNLIASEVPFSSTVGKSVIFTAPGGAVVAQIAIMVPSVAHDYRETAEAVAARIIAAWNSRQTASADLMICDGCGCTTTDAELAAMREGRKSLISCCPERKMRPATRADWDAMRSDHPAAPVSAGTVKAIADAAIRDCEAGAPISAANLARDVLKALSAIETPVSAWQGINPSQASLDVLAERQRQISKEGWTPEHDDQNRNGEMRLAAELYLRFGTRPSYVRRDPPPHWPWHGSWWKPTTQRRDLVKSGALILAEIERLDRAATEGGEA